MANILIVDDEPLICEMLEILLTREGHTAMTASDGEKAIEVAESVPVDLVIADIVMPEKDGLETLLYFRKQRPDVKTIAISGGSRIGNVDFLAMAKDFGASETFQKPLDNDKLIAAVNRCLSNANPA